MSSLVVCGPQTGLTFNERILEPEPEFAVRLYSEYVAETFDTFSRSCMDYYGGNPDLYPNAAMSVDPIPSVGRRNSISFMVAWGEGVDYPLPREHMLPIYFSRAAIRYAKIRRKSLEKATLNGYGFVGKLIFDEGEGPLLRTAIGGRAEKTIQMFDDPITSIAEASTAVTEIASDIALYRPLRLHRGVKWHARNGYIGNIFYDDDEGDALNLV